MEDIFKPIIGLLSIGIIVLLFPLWCIPYLAYKAFQWAMEL